MDQAASKIKKFFAKKKTDVKFKTAGPGVRLNSSESSSSSQSSSKQKKDAYVPIKRNDLTEEAKQARDAALRRVQENTRDQPLNVSARAIREQARREIEEQNKKKFPVEASSNMNQIQQDEKKDYSVNGVFFRCPMISEEILTKQEWKEKIKTFLYEQLDADPGLTSCLIIKNCNTVNKAEDCIETLKKYLTNIITSPDEPKYQKIRISNRVFCDKVANVEGSSHFLTAAGFHEVEIDGEKYMKWASDFPIELLIQLVEALDLSEVIHLDIERNLKILLPSQIRGVNLPPEFFRITPEELKKEQQARYVVFKEICITILQFFTYFRFIRAIALEEASILKTKAMRENEEKRFARNFRFTLIRVRFPDGLYLQV